jgi:hypothetical protein
MKVFMSNDYKRQLMDEIVQLNGFKRSLLEPNPMALIDSGSSLILEDFKRVFTT